MPPGAGSTGRLDGLPQAAPLGQGVFRRPGAKPGGPLGGGAGIGNPQFPARHPLHRGSPHEPAISMEGIMGPRTVPGKRPNAMAGPGRCRGSRQSHPADRAVGRKIPTRAPSAPAVHHLHPATGRQRGLAAIARENHGLGPEALRAGLDHLHADGQP